MAPKSVFAHAYAVVMAGGSGTRFWPLSRRKHPKQLLELFGHGTLLEQTVERIRPVIPPERIYVYTNELVLREVQRRLPQIPRAQIVAEPASRNTAPTLGVAAHEICRRDPQGVMVVLPADHVIAKPAEFLRVLRAGGETAENEGSSVVIGLKPTRPDTGFGYVRIGAREACIAGQEIYRVEKFTEKPPLAVARKYVASGRYLWNGGMFIWCASTLLENFAKHQPKMADQLARLAAVGGVRSAKNFRRLFPQFEKISIDFAIMEKVSDIYAVSADIGWNDVGSWAVVYDLTAKEHEANVRPERSLCLDSRGNMIVAKKKFVVTVGVQDMVIVETDDALLICPRDRSQDVGKAVQALEKAGLAKLL
ncbi:MAG TPA: mannose-1-phosphate guanylyltransferase [Terriglobia bacterium]|nr:mannose-1-phosphate guanylyltransferase [Terriglobia bacterium]